MRFKYFSLLLLLTLSTVSNAQLIKVWYQDADSDGYGNASVTSSYAHNGYVKNNIDCDDALPNNTTWGKLGNTKFAASNTAWSDFAVGGKGTAFFAYSDPAHATKASVMKKAAGDSVWTQLGTAGFSAAGISYCKIAADSKDTAWVITLESGNAKVYKYNGTSWTQVGANISSSALWPDIVIGANDTPYVAFVNGGRGKARKLIKTSNTWTSVGGGNITGTGINPQFLKMAMGANGFPFAAYQKTSDGQMYAYQLRGNTWTALGSGGKGSLGTATSTKADSIEMLWILPVTSMCFIKTGMQAEKLPYASTMAPHGALSALPGSLPQASAAVVSPLMIRPTRSMLPMPTPVIPINPW